MTIKEIREMTGLNQTKFAQRYEIPRNTIVSWERGYREPPEYVLRLLERVVRMDIEREKEEIRKKVER